MSQPDAYDRGFHDAYKVHEQELDELRQENEAMRGLIAANYRGMKEEIRKELENNSNTN